MELNKIDSSNRSTDLEVISMINSGKKECFEIIIRRYNQKLYRIIKGYIKTEEDVIDVIQETYIKAYQNLNQFKVNSQFSTWLIRIAINESLQFLRKSKREGNIIELYENISAESNKVWLNPEKHMEFKETNMIIEDAISKLPSKYRIVFILCEIEKMPQLEAAVLLDLTLSNLKVRLHRSKAMLKNELLKKSTLSSVYEFGNDKCDMIVNYVMSRIVILSR